VLVPGAIVVSDLRPTDPTLVAVPLATSLAFVATSFPASKILLILLMVKMLLETACSVKQPD
jgi:hypothetical protein